MALGFNLGDATLSKSIALSAAAGTVNSAGIDLGESANGEFCVGHEILISAPALTTTMAPDTRTFTYYLADSTDNSSFTVIPGLGVSVLVQTGASSAGAAATTVRVKLPNSVRRYVRLSVVGGASTGDASSVSATIAVKL